MTPAGLKILRAVEDVRSYVSRSLGVLVAAWCVTGVLALLLVSPFIAGPEGWRPGSPGPLLIAVIIVALVLGGAWYWRRLGDHWGGERRVTRAMDDVAELRPGSVQSGLELTRFAPEGTSPGLRALALESVGGRLDGDGRTLSGLLGSQLQRMIRRGVTSLCVVVPAVVLMLALSPDQTLRAWRGLIHPVAVIAEPELPPVTLEPGSMEVPRGAPVEVEISAPLRDSVTLHWDLTGQVTQSARVALADGLGRAALPPIAAETRYWAQAPDGARSGVHTLTPVDPLFVSTFVLEVTYPPYTSLPADEFRNEVPDLTVPLGTHFRIQGQGSRGIGSGRMVDDEGTTVASFQVQETRFNASWIPARSGTYSWEFSDAAGGMAAVTPEPVRLVLLPDQSPRIEIVYPGRDTILPVDFRQPLVLQMYDDYGIDRVEIVARRISSFGEAAPPVTFRMELEGLPTAVGRPLLDVSDWELTPGDTIRYLARAVDNHPTGQIGETKEYVLRVPRISELERAAQEELDLAAERMEALAEEALLAEQEARDLQRRSEQASDRDRNGREQAGEAEFEEREEISQALERQDRMMEAVDSLQRELAELREALRDAGLADPEVRDGMKELEELLEQLSPDEERDELAELMERLAEMNPDELAEMLERMAADQEDLRQRLEESVDQFRQAAIDQDFRATSQEAEELADQQEILADAMQEGGEDALRAEQQAALEQRAEDLQKQLETLQERLQEAGEQNAGAGVQEARHQLSEARQQMQQAQQMAQMGQQQNASEQAQQAAGDLSEVSQELSQAQQQMQQQMMEALQKALGQTATDALALARRQSELRQEMQGAGAGELAELRGDEAAIAQGIRNLAENYATGTQMAAPGSRDLMSAVGQAMDHLEGTIEAMEGRRGRNPSPMGEAEAVIQSLNEVALLAMTSGQQQGQAQGSASASEQMMQQLQQLAQQQGQIMQDASSLSPMQLGQETLSERMQEMAGQQEDVADDLGEMSEEGSQEGDEPLGDLQSMAEEAARLAEALAQGRLDPEVLRRQERLFHKLLDAGRSLERDEESEERESEVPGAYTQAGAADLTLDDLDALRFRIPNPQALRALSPAQRAMVLHYFERLNRSRAGNPDGPPLR